MAEIVLRDIHKYYGVQHVLRGVSLEIFEGVITGLLGKNGSGKTTIFKLISGEEQYDKGDMQIAKGHRIGVLDQIPVYPHDYSVYRVIDSAFEDIHRLKDRIDSLQQLLDQVPEPDETVMRQYSALMNEFEAKGGYEIETSLKMVCTGLGINGDMLGRPFRELSGGEKTRVNLARIILTDTDILLLDEPTNHLDINAVEWLEEYLEDFNGTVVVISHDRYFLDQVTKRTIEIEDGTATTYEGNYSKYAMLKEQNRIEQLKRYEQEQRKVRQLEAAVKRMHDWANRADNPSMHRRAFSMEKRMEKMVREGVQKPKAERKINRGFRTEDFSGSDIVLMKDVEFDFGSARILDGIDLLIRNKERLALLGNNGAGKTTLIRLIRGELAQNKGIVKVGASVRMAYLPQHITFDRSDLSVIDTIRYEFKIDEGSARNLLAGFMFRGEDVFKNVGSLSGGELSRLKLCILMQRDVNFLILDEPTNHLDIQSREWIEEALDAFEGTILFVSHDRYFIRKFATAVCELENGKLTTFDGDYESFREYKREIEEEKKRIAAERKLIEKPKQDTRVKKPDKKALEKKQSRLETDISDIEGRISEIETDMKKNPSDYEKLNALLAEKTQLSSKLEERYKEWMDVHEALKAIPEL